MALHKIPENYDTRKILEELLDRLERGQILGNVKSIIEKGNSDQENW